MAALTTCDSSLDGTACGIRAVFGSHAAGWGPVLSCVQPCIGQPCTTHPRTTEMAAARARARARAERPAVQRRTIRLYYEEFSGVFR